MKRPPNERVARFLADTRQCESWVLSGSLCSWGDSLIPLFTLAVFVELAPEIRLARLVARERERYGVRIDAGGDMAEHHQEFMEWARSYDTGDLSVRSLELHEKWIKQLKCSILRIDSSQSVNTLLAEVLKQLGN